MVDTKTLFKTFKDSGKPILILGLREELSAARLVDYNDEYAEIELLRDQGEKHHSPGLTMDNIFVPRSCVVFLKKNL